MSYFKVLGLQEEPFSTSPDPAFFFLSKGHKAALCRIQISISLKRGLCVIMGDVGTGKTTLSRKLSQVLREEKDTCFYMILNPFFKTQRQFLARLVQLFHIELPKANPSALECIEAVERFLYRKGVEENKTLVLLIDEAQLLPDYVLETLRILLNYETNEFKILQLLLVGQMELLPRISAMHNFWDRIALKCAIKPLDFDETREMIDFRLRHAGYEKGEPLFTDGAIRAVHDYTGGYPRKISLLCHNCIETLVVSDGAVVDEPLVRKLIEGDIKPVAAAGGVAHVF